MTTELDKGYWNIFIEELRTIFIEHEFNARWEIVTCYHEIGKRILDEFDNLERNKIYGKEIVRAVANSLNKSERTIERAIQFVHKYPDLSKVPEGKNITWNKIITKYLPTSKEKTITIRECWIKCPNCGHKFTMEKYNG